MGGEDDFVKVSTLDALQSSARHHITLRHKKEQHRYHSLLLFCFPAAAASPSQEDGNGFSSRFYCMEASCPHLGAPLENASIYDVEDEDDIEDAVIVCPWHEYDFSLSTGESSTGLKACTYAVEQRNREIWVQQPSSDGAGDSRDLNDESGWEVVEVRPVSESFALHRESAAQSLHAAVEEKLSIDGSKTVEGEATIDLNPLPTTLVEWAVLVLNTPQPKLKVEYTTRAAKAFRTGQCKGGIGGGRWSVDDDDARKWLRKERETPPEEPPRLKDAQVVQPGREGKRGKGGTEKGRIAMLHSLANIEQWAIDLAWDIIARAPELYAQHTLSSPTAPRSLPLQFYSDWLKVAEDECKHFSLLQQRLHDMGSFCGQLPVHHGLWESALETKHSLMSRLSIIHLVHEARGLDANPLTIKKFDNAGDKDSVKVLTTIHLDEVTHVSAGHRWLTFLCANAKPPLSPVAVFREEVRRHFAGRLKGPFNAQDRLKAGLGKEWYEDLAGERKRDVPLGAAQREEIPGG